MSEIHPPDASTREGDSKPVWILKRFLETVSAIMFACVFILFCYKIISRYLEHEEAAWTDEIAVILFIWIIFWANAFVVREKDQITFDLLYRPMSAKIKRGMAIARTLLVGGVFLCALPGSIGYLLFLRREQTPVLELPLGLVYSCFGVFMISVVVRSFWRFIQLVSPSWRDHL